MQSDATTDWYARPVLHVSNVEASLGFYVERLGFTVAWQFDESGRVFVAQLDRGGCSLIFSDQWPDKTGKGLMFISLNVEPSTYDDEVAAVDALRAELEARGAPVRDGWWGYRLLVVEDPDGNQLFFNCPNEPQPQQNVVT
ncbi:MAG TPA: glyoxalase superfamily protein [Vicinamibacterales bacterium]